MLKLKDIEAGYNSKPVLQGVSLSVGKGEVVALIGPNGSGKSTVLKTVMGIIRARRGEILYGGLPIIGHSPFENIRKGLAYVPQGNSVFSDLTVGENLRMGGYTLKNDTLVKARITEVPFVLINRKIGASKFNFIRMSPVYFFTALKLFFYRWFG